MVAGGGEPGGNEECAELVAVEADGVGLVVEPRPANMHCRRVLDHALLCGVAVEPRHC